MNQYPIKFKASKAFIAELYQCEYGRWSDAVMAREAGDADLILKNNYDLVFCDFGDRFKTQIEVRNDAELLELNYAVQTGTIDVHAPIARRNFIEQITPYVERVRK